MAIIRFDAGFPAKNYTKATYTQLARSHTYQIRGPALAQECPKAFHQKRYDVSVRIHIKLLHATATLAT